MRISEYQVAMDSQNSYFEAHYEEERLKFWVNMPFFSSGADFWPLM